MLRRLWRVLAPVLAAGIMLLGTQLWGCSQKTSDAPQTPQPPPAPAVAAPPPAPAVVTPSRPSDFSLHEPAQRAMPSVVNIFTSKEVKMPRHPFMDDPLFRRFFGDQYDAETQRSSSLGSGVIVGTEGYILTNHHVVEAADEIEIALNDGRQALDYLRAMLDEGRKPEEEFLMMISDIEMPEMDGYTLTAEIRHDPRMAKLHIVLHTSLSGGFNQAMVKKVGADDFLAKFRPDDLAGRVVSRIKTATPN